MNDNLAQMIKNGKTKAPVFSPENLDLENIGEEIPQTQQGIEIISLSEWFELNSKAFTNIRKVTVSIQGVDPAEQLIITVANPQPDKEDKRKLVVFEDAITTPVLNLSPVDMQVYNNGFRIIYEYSPEIFVKCYGVRTGLISVFCYDINDRMIPYSIVKCKKKDSHLEVPEGNLSTIQAKLQNQINLETLQLLYKQSSKAESLTTINDAINWLLARQSTIEDINHHMLIDNTIISITS
jgi:hypothetical protein